MSRYEIFESLGKGSMGTVHRAQDRLTGQYVALKRVETGSYEEMEFREALALEFETLSGLRHPNIVRVLDYGFDNLHQPFFTMTLLHQPKDLRVACDERDFFGKLDLIVQLLQAVAYLHRQDVLHRDLKPSNVLITASGRVHVLDFGLATSIASNATDTLGTVMYMSPETLRGETNTPAADLFAIGVMCMEVFTGVHPFDSAVVSDTITQILTKEPDFATLHTLTEGALVAAAASAKPTTTYSGLTLNQAQATTTVDQSPASKAERFTAVIKRLLSKSSAERQLDAYDVIDLICAALDMTPPPESSEIRQGFLRAARFVGRQDELKRLDAALAGVQQGGLGSAWLVSGESGVGKTRLLEEVRVRALVRGVAVAAGRADESDSQSFALSRGFLPPLLLTTPVSSHEARDLKHLVPEIDRIVGDAVETPAEPFSMAALRVQALILNLLKRISRPTLLLLEDLQWMGFEGGLIREITAIVPELPVLLIGTYRSDEAPYLYGNLHRSEQIELKRFTRHELGLLSQAMLGKPGESSAVVDMLERESEGNITFAIEILQDLSNRSRRLDDLNEDDLPHDVYTQGIMELAQRRISRLPLDYQPLMRLAAVAGREVNFEVLRYYDHVVKFPLWINAGMNAVILTNTDGKWQFAHDKLREGILRGIMPEERARLNRMVGDALLALHPDDTYLAIQVARHYADAGEWQAALTQLERAVLAFLPATQHIPELQTAAQRMFAHVTDSQQDIKMHLLRILGSLTVRAAERQQRVDYWSQALIIANKLNDIGTQVTLSRNIISTLIRASDFDAARPYMRTLYELVATSDQDEYVAKGLITLADVATTEGDYRAAADHNQKAAALFAKVGDERSATIIRGNLAESQLALGQFDTARQNSMLVWQYFKATNEHSITGVTLLRVVQANLHLHHYATAASFVQELERLVQEIDHSLLNDYLTHYQALLALRTDDLETSAAHFRSLLDAKRAQHDVDAFHLLMYAPLSFALVGDVAATLATLKHLCPIFDAEKVKPPREYEGYLLLGFSAYTHAKADRAATALACAVILHSTATTGELREHTTWWLERIGLEPTALSAPPMDATTLLSALRARFAL